MQIRIRKSGYGFYLPQRRWFGLWVNLLGVPEQPTMNSERVMGFRECSEAIDYFIAWSAKRKAKTITIWSAKT